MTYVLLYRETNITLAADMLQKLTRAQLSLGEADNTIFFYEILVAASVVWASCYEISQARNFFATFR